MTPILFLVFSAISTGVSSFPAATSNGIQKPNIEVGAQSSSHPDITQVITFRPDYSSDHNLRQDELPAEDDLQRYRRNAEAEADYEDDDSDMYMEPIQENEKSESKRAEVVAAREPAVVPTSAPAPVQKDNEQLGQHFFPSFAPVFSLGHSRPHQLFHQEPFYTPKTRASALGSDYNPFRSYRESAYKVPINFEDDAISTNILGSGNFGVLRGGTYYNDEDDYNGFYGSHYSNNGHGRPYYSNPRPQKYISGDFFSNFRDFAEINTPAKASYSQYIVVYINKNATNTDEAEAPSPGSITKPKNIFEQLTLLDSQGESGDESKESEEDEKKMSLHKRKLTLLKEEKQKKSYYKSRDSKKDFLEPLLALS